MSVAMDINITIDTVVFIDIGKMTDTFDKV